MTKDDAKLEAQAQQAARAAGWIFRRVPGYWTHKDHATWDSSAAELCRFYRIEQFYEQGGKGK